MLIVPWTVTSQDTRHRGLSETERGERQRDGMLFLKTWKVLQRLVEAGTARALGAHVNQAGSFSMESVLITTWAAEESRVSISLSSKEDLMLLLLTLGSE